jgi:hypothetical protein
MNATHFSSPTQTSIEPSTKLDEIVIHRKQTAKHLIYSKLLRASNSKTPLIWLTAEVNYSLINNICVSHWIAITKMDLISECLDSWRSSEKFWPDVQNKDAGNEH